MSLLGVFDSDSSMCSGVGLDGDNGVGEDYVPYDSNSGEKFLRCIDIIFCCHCFNNCHVRPYRKGNTQCRMEMRPRHDFY